MEPIQKTTNVDGTLTLDLVDNSLEAFFNSLPVYNFKKEFTSSNSSYLKRVYKVTLDNDTHLGVILNRSEIEYAELVKYPEPLYLPDDYQGLFGTPLSQLDLIKAPFAWNITKGSPSVRAGIVDTYFDIYHEDLVNQIVGQLNTNGAGTHGTAVAGALSAQTDNSMGISSIGFNTKLVLLSKPYNRNDIIDLSLYPGVRVINISAGQCDYSPVVEELYREIWEDNGVLVVCAAGNAIYNGSCTGDPEQYVYPASYDHTVSVTGVGHIFPLGTNDPILGRSNWKDVHEEVIGDPNSTLQHNDKVDICAPGYRISTTANNNNYSINRGTSFSSPIVAGVAALMFSVNPSLTPNQVRDILKNTADDIYQIPENAPYIGLLGTGRVNAYRAVKEAQCMLNPNPELDLMVRNSEEDDGTEPDTTTEYLWRSNDIWVRNLNDGRNIQEHENPIYNTSSPNYVYVRVTNNSCVTSSGNDILKLYWAKANTTLFWPQNWNGTMYIEDPVTHENILMGEEVGTLNIPVLEPGEEAIIEFEWFVPNPQDYININQGNPWHFCLLSRIESTDDPMTFPEVSAITQNVKNNNNIAWKNTTVVDLYPNTTSQIGGVVAVSNPFSTIKAFNLQFIKDTNEPGQAIYDEAEVSIEMDSIFYDAWSRGGNQGLNYDSTKVPGKKIATGNNMTFNNILFDPNEIGTVYVKFNFLTSQLTTKNDFVYHVIQRDAVTNEIIGGETYEVHKRPRPAFDADAGTDEDINKNESVTINAGQINEAAVYNWYDPDGNLIYTGTDLTVSPDVTQTYKLEIITDLDGFKDYDEVEVTVNPYLLQSLVPNPASNAVVVNYDAEDATSAYLMVTNTSNGTSNNYILDTTEFHTNLDISSYPAGLYSVALVCNGQIQQSKTLAKQ
ncbi:MAG: S8/S53 family peptidase [Aequorivita sp.]|nr:S8/S53 family peptidase [Aequorivita sp.]